MTLLGIPVVPPVARTRHGCPGSCSTGSIAGPCSIACASVGSASTVSPWSHTGRALQSPAQLPERLGPALLLQHAALQDQAARIKLREQVDGLGRRHVRRARREDRGRDRGGDLEHQPLRAVGHDGDQELARLEPGVLQGAGDAPRLLPQLAVGQRVRTYDSGAVRMRFRPLLDDLRQRDPLPVAAPAVLRLEAQRAARGAGRSSWSRRFLTSVLLFVTAGRIYTESRDPASLN
jgi:hypothetical protein